MRRGREGEWREEGMGGGKGGGGREWGREGTGRGTGRGEENEEGKGCVMER